MRTSCRSPQVSPPRRLPQVSRKCAECEEEDKLQKKEAATAAPALSEAPASVHATLRSPGQPLDAATRAFFEPRGSDTTSLRYACIQMSRLSHRPRLSTRTPIRWKTGLSSVRARGHQEPMLEGGCWHTNFRTRRATRAGHIWYAERSCTLNATVTTEDPIRRVLSTPGSAFALTTPTVNGTELTGSNAIGEIKQAFQPKAVVTTLNFAATRLAM